MNKLARVVSIPAGTDRLGIALVMAKASIKPGVQL